MQVFLGQITGTPPTAQAPCKLTNLLNDPVTGFWHGNTFIGDYIGLAVRGGTGYAAFPYNTEQGIFSGVKAPEENNHLAPLTCLP
jgi:hypothetical protein